MINKMIIKQKLKKGDIVIVIAGKDKGKTGEILRVFPKENRAIVSGVNIITKHQKPTKEAFRFLLLFQHHRLIRAIECRY